MPDPECIFVFDLETGVLESRPIGRVYGQVNFYQDKGNDENRNHLEEKLAFLENNSARIITDIHTSLPSGEVVLARKDSEVLRKFLFLMHYRSDTISRTYFQEDHPGNAHAKGWIRNFKKKRNFTSDAEVWLDGINYYLETPHHTILAHSKENKKAGGTESMITMMIGGEIDIDMPHYHAEAYTNFVNNYFLAVWEAADDSEFILGHNAFGLWEGTFLGVKKLFKIYVVSPRVVLVFKTNISRHMFPSVEGDSTLTDIPIAKPIPRYIRSFPPPGQLSPEDVKEFQAYVSSAEAQQDTFMFKITKLSQSQTYLINQIVLQNVQQNGSITFASHTFMSRTIRRYDTPEGPFTKENRKRLRPLMAQLSVPPTERDDFAISTDIKDEDLENSSKNSGTTPRVTQAPVKLLWESQADFTLRETYYQVESGTLTFRSDYDRAIHLLPIVSNSSERVIREGTEIAISHYSRVLEVPELSPDSTPDMKLMPLRRGSLVSSLAPQHSSHLFNLVELPSFGDVPETRMARAIYQVIVVGLLKWMVDNHCDVAEKLFPSIPFIEYESVDELRVEETTTLGEDITSLETPEPPEVIERGRIVFATSPDDDVVEGYLRPPSTSTAGNIQRTQSFHLTSSSLAHGVTQQEEVNPRDSFIPDDTVNSVEGTFRLGTKPSDPIPSFETGAPQGLPLASSATTENGVIQPPPRAARSTNSSKLKLGENAEVMFEDIFPVIGDQSADALIDAVLLQIMRGQDGFTSRYDRALRIFQLASSQEDMANPVALTIRDAVRFMVDRVSSLVIAVDGAPPDELPKGHLVNHLRFTESELLFVSIKAHPYFCHFSINLGEMEGTYIGALTHDAVIVGVLSWLVEKRSDVAKRRFPRMPVFEFSAQVNHKRTWRRRSLTWLFCVLGFYILYQPTVADLFTFSLCVGLYV